MARSREKFTFTFIVYQNSGYFLHTSNVFQCKFIGRQSLSIKSIEWNKLHVLFYIRFIQPVLLLKEYIYRTERMERIVTCHVYIS
jgi:hypothetical protein